MTVHLVLCALEPLKRGHTSAREHPRVGPAPADMVDAVRPFLSKSAREFAELQLVTGARAGELIEQRVCDIEVDEQTGVWSYWPPKHKNAHREHERVIYFGPRAQDILQPFRTERAETDHLFSPAEAEADRREERRAQRTTPTAGWGRREESEGGTLGLWFPPQGPPTNRHDTGTPDCLTCCETVYLAPS